MSAANLQAPFTKTRGQSEPSPPPDQTPNAPVREPEPKEPKKYGLS